MGSCREDCVTHLHVLSCQIRTYLQHDQKQHASQVALEAEGLLANNEIHEAYCTIQGWYHDRTYLQSKPTFIELQARRQEYESLYVKCCVAGQSLLINVDPYLIPDDIPDEDEIISALHCLHRR